MTNHDFRGVDNVSGRNSAEIFSQRNVSIPSQSLEPYTVQHFVAQNLEAEEAERNKNTFQVKCITRLFNCLQSSSQSVFSSLSLPLLGSRRSFVGFN